MTSGRRELTATAYLALRLLFDAIEKDHSLFDEPPDTIRARLDQLSRLLPREEKEDTRQLHELFIEQRKSLFCNLAAGPKKSNKTSSRTGRSRKTPSNRRNITQNKKAIHQQLQPQVTTFQWIAPSTQKPPQSQTANSKPSEQPIVNREIQIQRWQAYDPENKDGLSVYYELVNQQERLKAFFTRTPQSSIVAQNKKEQKEDHPILRLIDDNETPHRFFKHTLCGYASLFLFVDSQGYRGENEGTIQKDYLLLWEGRSKRVHKGLHFGEKVARLENKLPGAGMLAICLKEKLNNTSITQIDALCLYIKQDETLQRLLPLFSNAEGEQDFWDWAIGTGTARSKKLTSGSSELDSNFRHAISSSTTPAPNQSTTTCVDDGGDHSDGPRTTDCVTLSNSRSPGVPRRKALEPITSTEAQKQKRMRVITPGNTQLRGTIATYTNRLGDKDSLSQLSSVLGASPSTRLTGTQNTHAHSCSSSSHTDFTGISTNTSPSGASGQSLSSETTTAPIIGEINITEDESEEGGGSGPTPIGSAHACSEALQVNTGEHGVNPTTTEVDLEDRDWDVAFNVSGHNGMDFMDVWLDFSDVNGMQFLDI